MQQKARVLPKRKSCNERRIVTKARVTKGRIVMKRKKYNEKKRIVTKGRVVIVTKRVATPGLVDPVEAPPPCPRLSVQTFQRLEI